MTSPLATGIALLLYAIALLPPALAAWRGAFGVPTGVIVTAAVVAVALFSTGLLQRKSLADTDVTPLLASDVLLSRCEETLDLLLEAQVIRERPSPQGLVVNGPLWDQLPSELHEPVLGCAQELVGGDEPVEVIRR